jgi:phosphoglycolate phosphatase-like HAD superfamily hydrolase
MGKLVLFDIDGTLIDSGDASVVALTKVFRSLYDITDAFISVRMDGKTDKQIIKEGVAANGLRIDDEDIPSIIMKYLINLKKEINNDRKHLKPGVRDLLIRLGQADDFHLGLLTGNIESGARLKLEVFDLNRYFPFGAFGSDHEDRNRLLPIAIDKFSKMTGQDIRFEDCIVVGDTPKDVECSRPYGAISVAVTTGIYSSEQLAVAGADYVLPDLTHAMAEVAEFVPE